jgi:carbon-monoxide dehydrogenase medium subunit
MTAVTRPERLADALRLLADLGDTAKIAAGGTAVMPMLRSGLLSPDRLIALERLQELHEITVNETSVRIGALVSLRELHESTVVRQVAPTFARALMLVANHRIRHRATIGGNVSEADYASDPPTVLATLECLVHISNVHGERTVPLADFLVSYYETALTPVEIVTAISFSIPSASARTTYLKFLSRTSDDRPCLGVAAYLDLDDRGRTIAVRVAVAGATATPFALPEVLDDCLGIRSDHNMWQAVGDAYAEEIHPISDARGSAAYRKHVTGVLVSRALDSVSAAGYNTAVRM